MLWHMLGQSGMDLYGNNPSSFIEEAAFDWARLESMYAASMTILVSVQYLRRPVLWRSGFHRLCGIIHA